jgi:transposase-like protein
VLPRRIVERYAGGLSQRDLESAVAKARGQFVSSQSAVSDIPERLTQEDEALRTRDLRGFDLADLCLDTVYEPLRRWGRKTGALCVWGLCVDGRTGLLTRSTTKSERDESCREVLRDLRNRGLQTPGTLTTDGAPGVIQAVDSLWPRSLRRRWWLHTRQHRHQQVPPQAGPAFKA